MLRKDHRKTQILSNDLGKKSKFRKKKLRKFYQKIAEKARISSYTRRKNTNFVEDRKKRDFCHDREKKFVKRF